MKIITFLVCYAHNMKKSRTYVRLCSYGCVQMCICFANANQW